MMRLNITSTMSTAGNMGWCQQLSGEAQSQQRRAGSLVLHSRMAGRPCVLTGNNDQCNAQATDVVPRDVHTGCKGSIVSCGGELQAALFRFFSTTRPQRSTDVVPTGWHAWMIGRCSISAENWAGPAACLSWHWHLKVTQRAQAPVQLDLT